MASICQRLNFMANLPCLTSSGPSRGLVVRHYTTARLDVQEAGML
jgi:hypothetical protein